MIFKKMSLGPLGTNCYIIHNEKREALIIDPSGEPDKITSYIASNQLYPQAILLTHAHFDHIMAVDEIRNKYEIAVHLHTEEVSWLEDPLKNGSRLFLGKDITTDAPDEILHPGEIVFRSIMLKAVHTPGHSPGSMTFIFPESEQIVCGDVLFNQGIGRTDLPGGNYQQLEESIRNTLYHLPDHYKVLPGHGPDTKIGFEKRSNPFVQEK